MADLIVVNEKAKSKKQLPWQHLKRNGMVRQRA